MQSKEEQIHDLVKNFLLKVYVLVGMEYHIWLYNEDMLSVEFRNLLRDKLSIDSEYYNHRTYADIVRNILGYTDNFPKKERFTQKFIDEVINPLTEQ